jgi:hypothetical protein
LTLDQKSGLKTDDVQTIVSGIAQNKIGQDLLWDWFLENWNQISSQFSKEAIGNVISAVTSDFNKDRRLEELRQFYIDHSDELGSADQAMLEAIKKTKINIGWMKSYRKEVVQWLKRKNDEAADNY